MLTTSDTVGVLIGIFKDGDPAADSSDKCWATEGAISLGRSGRYVDSSSFEGLGPGIEETSDSFDVETNKACDGAADTLTNGTSPGGLLFVGLGLNESNGCESLSPFLFWPECDGFAVSRPLLHIVADQI